MTEQTTTKPNDLGAEVARMAIQAAETILSDTDWSDLEKVQFWFGFNSVINNVE